MRWETAWALAEKLHNRGGLFVARFNLPPPKRRFDTHVLRERSFFLKLQALRKGDVLAPPEFFETVRAAEINPWPFANHERLAA